MDSKKDHDYWQVSVDSLNQSTVVGADYTESSTYSGLFGDSGPQGYIGDSDTITLSASDLNVSLSSPYTVTGSMTSGIGAGISGITGSTAPWFTQNPSARISLSGEDADIEVNGWSLVSAVKRIEERLGLFQPNPELESEWSDLRELGEQYRKLEQYIRDKQATFDRLKAMPAPEID